MSYYKLLGLEKEPFSTSPDPDFFYESKAHRTALMKLMVDIRLKRGLSLIIGDVGTGKTTLSRKLFHMLRERNDIIFHMILDPVYDSEQLFLESLIRTFKIQLETTSPTILDYKEAIKNYLFQKGVQEKLTVVLLVDEAQKLNSVSLEGLRVLLNYETNEYKLLQLVMLAQTELLPKLRPVKNLWDRISLKYMLNPLDERETKEMIEFRLKAVSRNPGAVFFTDEAMVEVYRYTQGYPRRIATLCHNALKSLVMLNKTVVEIDLIKDLISQEAEMSVC